MKIKIRKKEKKRFSAALTLLIAVILAVNAGIPVLAETTDSTVVSETSSVIEETAETEDTTILSPTESFEAVKTTQTNQAADMEIPAAAYAAETSYILQKANTQCSAAFNFSYGETTNDSSCNCTPGTKVTVKITVTPNSGYEFNRIEIRDGYGANSGQNLSEKADLTPVAGEDMTWTFTMPEKPESGFAVLHVICTEKAPELAVNLISNASTELEYDTNNVLFTANVTKDGYVCKTGTVQFYLNNNPIGEPVRYDTDSYYYTGFYKVICSCDNGSSPYLSMGENTIYAIYTYTDGTTIRSNDITINLVKQNITRILTKGRTIGELYYNGEYQNIALIGWSATDEWKSKITKDSFDLTATKDGQPVKPEYSDMKNGTTFNFLAKDPGVYVYTAAIKADNPYYCGSITTEPKEILNAQNISVTITWGELCFTYTDGAWDPDTHTAGRGNWTDSDSGWINMANSGGVPVNVTCAYSPEEAYTDITGSFTDGTNDITNSVALAVNEEKKIYLTLAGKPGETLNKTQLGIVTVRIEEGGE